MPSLRRIAVLAAAPLALTLAACGDSAEEAAPSGEPISPVAAPAGQSWVETAAETPEGGFVIGNPNAPIKLVEYASHTCHVCAEFSQKGAAEMDEYVATGVISYEIRNLIRDPLDLSIAMLARCGAPQAFHPLANQAWQNFDAIMASAQANGAALQQAQTAPPAQRLQAVAQAAGLLDFFAARGISRDQALQCLADTGKAQRIAEASQSQADDLQISGTPSFFINGRKVEPTSWVALEPLLQAAGARQP
jgi:protein-disulfide isomerase